MEITYDPDKRDLVLKARNLDLADAGEVFAGFHRTRVDEKHADVEERYITVGLLKDDVVIVVWTPRKADRPIVTMWKANDRERKAYQKERDRSG